MSTKRQLDEQAPAVKCMLKWGTNARFAAAIGRAPSTTDRWLANGNFVGSDIGTIHRDIVEAGRRDDIIIRPTDLVDMRIFEGESAVA